MVLWHSLIWNFHRVRMTSWTTTYIAGTFPNLIRLKFRATITVTIGNNKYTKTVESPQTKPFISMTNTGSQWKDAAGTWIKEDCFGGNDSLQSQFTTTRFLRSVTALVLELFSEAFFGCYQTRSTSCKTPSESQRFRFHDTSILAIWPG